MPEQKKELRFLPYPLFCGVLLVLMILAGCSSGSSESSSMGESQVYPPPHKEYLYIELQEREITLNVGETYQLSVKINSNMANEDIAFVWSSYNESVATVSTNGLVSAKSFGYTTIEVYAKNGWNRYTCNITVNDPNMLTSENAAEILGKDYKYKTTIVIPDGVTNIGNYIFDYCKELVSVSIPTSVTSIENYAFNGCSGLTVIYAGTKAEWEALNVSLSGGTSVSCRDGDIDQEILNRQFLTIENNVVVNCSSAASGAISIPNGVTAIGDHAFEYCTRVTSVSIPNSVTSVGYGVFSACDNLSAIHIENIENWLGIHFANSWDNPLSRAKHLYIDGEELTDLIIPNGITAINECAFYNCESLQTVTIQEGVTSIGGNAFYGCSSLTSVTIPNSVTSIESGAFSGCDNLSAVSIENIENWFGMNFANWWDNPLSDAKHLYIDGEELTDLVISDGTTTINAYAFYNCESLQTVTIPKSVTSIGSQAFFNCKNIETVYVASRETWKKITSSFPSSIKNIIFMDESGLGISVKFPESNEVTKLNWSADGNIVTISAESSHSSYIWFVDMQKQSATENVLHLDTTDMKAGLYSVMVVIDGRYSDTVSVEILK